MSRDAPEHGVAELPARQVEIQGRRIRYVEIGTGAPILFLHGNPASSYLWRNVMPVLAAHGRCLAPDLFGMGGSDKVDPSGPDSYSFVAHRASLEALLQALGITGGITLVLHGWGAALGFDWANRHRDAVIGIAYMEAIVRPLYRSEWDPRSRALIEALRAPAGEELVLRDNVVLDRLLPEGVLRELSAPEAAVYRRPFAAEGEARRPNLAWARQLPLDGEPADVTAIVAAYAAWLAGSDVPKLFVNADPGAILTGAPRDFCRTWPNQCEVTVPGLHFIQEDSPHQIGTAIADWRRDLVRAA